MGLSLWGRVFTQRPHSRRLPWPSSLSVCQSNVSKQLQVKKETKIPHIRQATACTEILPIWGHEPLGRSITQGAPRLLSCWPQSRQHHTKVSLVTDLKQCINNVVERSTFRKSRGDDEGEGRSVATGWQHGGKALTHWGTEGRATHFVKYFIISFFPWKSINIHKAMVARGSCFQHPAECLWNSSWQ